MSTTEIRAGSVAIRDEADGFSLEGTAIVYGEDSGQTAEYGTTPERFQPGAFRQALRLRRPAPFFSRHGGEMIGAVTFDDSPEALRYKGRLFDTPGALAYREAVRAGIDGASIEFVPGVVQRQNDRVMHREVKSIVAIAGTHVPAYESARVAVRGEQNVTETTEAAEPKRRTDDEIDAAMRAVALEATTSLRREMAERDTSGSVVSEVDRALLSVRNLAELWHAIDDNRELRGIYSRALADQITTNNPGVMGSGNMLGSIKRLIDVSRPAINAWGRASLTGSGMTVDYPYFAGTLSALVGEQATQKTEITSVRVDILKGTTPIRTWAGGSDISYQLLKRSDPSYLEAYVRIMFQAYAVVTEAAFVDAIEAATTPFQALTWATATPAQIQAALGAASVKVLAATGAPASFGIAAPDVFGAVLSANLTVGTTNGLVTGNQASDLTPVVSGIRIYADPSVTAGVLLLSNESTADWHEDGPYQIDDEDVAKLGRNVAVWGMGAAAIYTPAGIIRVGPSTTREGTEAESEGRSGKK